jgi:preprotein translocase subunit SecY
MPQPKNTNAKAIASIVLAIVALGLAYIYGVLPVQAALKAGLGSGAVLTPVLTIFACLGVAAFTIYLVWGQSVFKQTLVNICTIPQLFRKLVFTMALLCIYRIGFHVPLPGLNQERVKTFMTEQSEGVFGSAIQYFGLFTGGTLRQSTLFGLGIMPYISASIIFQLLATVVPALEKLQKEGPAGYKKIQEYTRYATVGLCVIQAIVWMKIMMGGGEGGGKELLVYPEYAGSYLVFIMGVVGLTTGTMFLMWLGEQIDEYGIGNGISLIIMAGIVARLPWAILHLATTADFSLAAIGSSNKTGPEKVLFLAFAFVFVVAGVILITQGQRRILVKQSKHMRGRKMYGGQDTHLPLRVNHGGVMPIIFASSLMIFPNAVFRWFSSVWYNDFTRTLAEAFNPGSYTHEVLYIAMIFFFAYFWTTVQFRPKEMAENLQERGLLIPGRRAGPRTVKYLTVVMERITYCGAAFLSVIAVLPEVVGSQMKVNWEVTQFLGGTGLLICVSVTLDLVQRIDANLALAERPGLLGGSTRIKGATR